MQMHAIIAATCIADASYRVTPVLSRYIFLLDGYVNPATMLLVR